MSDVAKFEHGTVQRMPDPEPQVTPMAMIDRALSAGASVETLEKLMALQERWEANNARRAFDAAISAARAEIPPIVKSAEVDYTTSKGRTNYKHETLDAIARAVDPILAKNGLSYRFRSSQQNGQLHVTCIVAHRDGYSEETTLSGPPDQSGSKNAYQAVGSAATYLQRYTLKLALGLSAAKDDDAQAVNHHDEPDPPRPAPEARQITEGEYMALRQKAEAAGVDTDVLCERYGFPVLAAFTADAFGRAMKKLDATIKARQPVEDAEIVGDEIPY